MLDRIDSYCIIIPELMLSRIDSYCITIPEYQLSRIDSYCIVILELLLSRINHRTIQNPQWSYSRPDTGKVGTPTCKCTPHCKDDKHGGGYVDVVSHKRVPYLEAYLDIYLIAGDRNYVHSVLASDEGIAPCMVRAT
ncbi:hypothetical protein B296_00056377 [Ensete ventricosum]|uniref:Uncharacterized protein n=1 Tax=Ensete ventricosum TaxID=4639 RepID=A0A426X2Y8_ENSVE|nr:hypothetical protein B296_00056377 [Ensete ventricosum]